MCRKLSAVQQLAQTVQGILRLLVVGLRRRFQAVHLRGQVFLLLRQVAQLLTGLVLCVRQNLGCLRLRIRNRLILDALRHFENLAEAVVRRRFRAGLLGHGIAAVRLRRLQLRNFLPQGVHFRVAAVKLVANLVEVFINLLLIEALRHRAEFLVQNAVHRNPLFHCRCSFLMLPYVL